MNQENCCTDWYEQVLLQDFLPQGREDQRLTLEICLWKLSALWASLQNAPATLTCRVFSFLLFLLRGLPESTWGLTSCLWTWRMMAAEKKHLFPPIEGPWHNFWLSSSMLISTCGCWLPTDEPDLWVCINCWSTGCKSLSTMRSFLTLSHTALLGGESLYGPHFCVWGELCFTFLVAPMHSGHLRFL